MQSKRSRYVYRIENKAGRGPYSTGFCSALSRELYSDARHPGPHDDRELGYFSLAYRRRFVFGFRTKAQLRSWFYPRDWRQALHDAGYRLTKWRVPAGMAHVSDVQAVFRRSLSVLVETTNLI